MVSITETILFAPSIVFPVNVILEVPQSCMEVDGYKAPNTDSPTFLKVFSKAL